MKLHREHTPGPLQMIEWVSPLASPVAHAARHDVFSHKSWRYCDPAKSRPSYNYSEGLHPWAGCERPASLASLEYRYGRDAKYFLRMLELCHGHTKFAKRRKFSRAWPDMARCQHGVADACETTHLWLMIVLFSYRVALLQALLYLLCHPSLINAETRTRRLMQYAIQYSILSYLWLWVKQIW